MIARDMTAYELRIPWNFSIPDGHDLKQEEMQGLMDRQEDDARSYDTLFHIILWAYRTGYQRGQEAAHGGEWYRLDWRLEQLRKEAMRDAWKEKG